MKYHWDRVNGKESHRLAAYYTSALGQLLNLTWNFIYSSMWNTCECILVEPEIKLKDERWFIYKIKSTALIKDRLSTNHLHSSNALTLYICYTQVCGLILSKVSNYNIVVSHIKTIPVHWKFAYFRPVHAVTKNKLSLEQAWGKLGAFKTNHCNINCVRNRYACYHGNWLKCTEEYQAVTNTMKMLETRFVIRAEDKDLFQILSEVPEDNTRRKHMVLEKGTDKYSTTKDQ